MFLELCVSFYLNKLRIIKEVIKLLITSVGILFLTLFSACIFENYFYFTWFQTYLASGAVLLILIFSCKGEHNYFSK